MTALEFAPIMAYIATATGAPKPTREQTEVYFDLLKDVPLNVLSAAAKQAVLDHVYPTLPPAGVIRKAANALQQPATTGPEAWRLFVAAVRKHGSGKRRVFRAGHDPVDIDNRETGLASLPPQVARAAANFGWETLCDTSPDDMGIAQTQFLKVYATMADHEQRLAIMPPSVKAVAAGIAGAFGMPEPKQLQLSPVGVK